MTGDFSTLLQGVLGGGAAGVLAIIFGIWDRRMKSRQDARTDARQDLQSIEAIRAKAIEHLQKDLDDARRRVDELEEEQEAERTKRSRVWRAARRMEDFALTQHRLANERIAAAAAVERLRAGGETVLSNGMPIASPAPLDPPPTLESFMPPEAAPGE